MTNTSATGGYLLPSAAGAPLEDDALQDFFQAWIVGITGLAGAFVRPSWQGEPPNIPADRATAWIAFRIRTRKGDTFAAELHQPNLPTPDDGQDVIIRQEELELVCSVYGRSADAVCAQLREGASVAQNREPLTLANMGLISVGEPIDATAVLIKQEWLYRVDMAIRIRREIRRVYPVLNLLEANGTVTAEDAGAVSIVATFDTDNEQPPA